MGHYASEVGYSSGPSLPSTLYGKTADELVKKLMDEINSAFDYPQHSARVAIAIATYVEARLVAHTETLAKIIPEAIRAGITD